MELLLTTAGALHRNQIRQHTSQIYIDSCIPYIYIERDITCIVYGAITWANTRGRASDPHPTAKTKLKCGAQSQWEWCVYTSPLRQCIGDGPQSRPSLSKLNRVDRYSKEERQREHLAFCSPPSLCPLFWWLLCCVPHGYTQKAPRTS
jgi:hypothetical protein